MNDFIYKHSGIVYMILAMLVIAGIWGLQKMNKDEFPTFEIKQGLIAAVYPGADVYQVEEQVGKPLEKLLFEFSEVNRSGTKVVSKDGMCYIYVDLVTPSAKKDEVWSKIKLKINAFKMLLPPGVIAVMVMDDFSAISTVLIAMEADDKGYSEMREYAENLSSRLREIPELSNVKILGLQDEEIAVTIDFEKLSAYGISTSSLMLDYQMSNIQALGANFVTDYTKSPIHLPKTISDEEELYNKIVYSSPDGQILRLRDIANIERRYKETNTIVNYNGNNAVVLSVEMRPDNNIIAFGEDVDKVIDEFMLQAPESLKISRITDQPKVVDSSVWSFLRDLLISMIVVIVVMLLLFPMRSALIASSGVPVCTAIALAMMYCFGICLNTVSLAALIVVLGMIVDDSVITMDGYMDKLSRNKSRLDAAKASVKELFMPMFMATFAISAMFFPMKYIITGYLGDFVSTFPWVISFSLMTSLAYAVLVVPSLEVRFISQAKSRKSNVITKMQNGLFHILQSLYDKAQGTCFKYPKLTILSAIIAVALGILMFTSLNVQMMPMAVRPFFAAEVYLDPSSDIKATEQISDSLSRIFRQDKRVVSVTEFIGTGAPRFHCTYAPLLPGSNIAQIIVTTNTSKDTEAMLAEYEQKYENYFPNASIHFKQMDYQGTSTPIEVQVSGENREDLLEAADSIKAFMMGIDEIKWVHSDNDWNTNIISIALDSDRASSLGINRAMMNLSLVGMFNGSKLSSIWESGREIPINLYSSNIDKDSPYDVIGNAIIPSSIPGQSAHIRQISQITPEWNPERLVRQNGKSVIGIGADMKFNKSQPVAARKLKQFLSSYNAPDGVTITLGGLNSANGQMIPEIALSFIAAVMVLFFFLVFHFKKVSLAILTIVLSALCLFGAFFGLWIFKLDFSMTAVLGLVSLVGIIVRNGIILFDYAEELRQEKSYSVRLAAEEAGKRRMRPIFLTSCTTALGVLPMIISGDSLWMPMGVVICFGTILSVILITLVMPIAYWLIFEKSSNNKINGVNNSERDNINNDSNEYKIGVITVISILLISTNLSAQGNKVFPSTKVIQLSLEDCQKAALQKNYKLQNAELDLRAAKYQKNEAFTAYFPKVYASAFGFWSLNPLIDIDVKDVLGNNDFSNNLMPIIDNYANIYGFNTSYTTLKQGFSTSVMALQPVYMGGKIVNSNKLASIAVSAAQIQRQLQEEKTEKEIEELWWQTVSLIEKQSMVDSLKLIMNQVSKTVKSATDAGLVPEKDKLQINIRESELNSSAKQLKMGIRIMKMNLLNSISQQYTLYSELATDSKPYIDDIVLEFDRDMPLTPQEYWKDENEIYANLEERQLLDIQVKAKELEKKIALADALPRFAVGAGWSYSNLMDKYNMNTILVATLNIPISDWGAVKHKTNRLEMQAQKARNEREYLNSQLSVMVSKLWMDLVVSYDKWQDAKEKAEVSQKIMELNRDDFKAGIVPIQNLLEAQAQFQSSKNAEFDALLEYRTAIRTYLILTN